MDVVNEQILVQRLREGEGFEEVVREHSPRLLGLACRLVSNRTEAEDLVQEAFLRLHRSIGTFRGECLIGTWLYRTVSRLAIDYLRRERIRRRIFFFRRDEEDVDPLENVAAPGPSPRDYLQADETGQRLKKALCELSPRQRAVFVLRHQEDLPLKEIARILGLEEGTVKVHLHRAVNFLRKEFRDLREDPS